MAGALDNHENYFIFSTQNAVLIGVIGLIIAIFYQRRSGSNTPPCHTGWLPFIGCAIEFGKAPLWFIEQMRLKLGPVFTLKVAGKRLTFVTDPDDYRHFMSSNNVDFQTAVQDPVKHVASVTRESFFENHTKIHDAVKGSLGPHQLEPFCHNLHIKFKEKLGEWGNNGSRDLNKLVRTTMYCAVLDNLFGDNTLPTKDKSEYEILEKNFVLYDELFEYGSSLPEFVLKEWSRSKWWLIGKFQKIAKTILDNQESSKNETVLQILLHMVDRPHAPNYGLLLMWASLANAIPQTFWTLSFILHNPKVLKEVREEVDLVMANHSEITMDTVSELRCVKRCLMEAIRLRSPGVITRAVVKEFTMKGYRIPVGDMLMLSPYWSHRNAKFFPDPETFNPDRWKECNLDNNQFLEGFVAFGGGRYQCPGRWFALLEIQLLLAMIFHKFDMEPLDPLPKLSPLHLVGTQQPEQPMRIRYSERKLA